MKKNMAGTDRLLRLVLSLLMVVLFWSKHLASPYNYLLLWIAWTFLVTGVVGNCPLYKLFRINTRQLK